jgi:hypothetical protein
MSASATTSARGSRCQPGMWATWAQRPAPTTATLTLSDVVMGFPFAQYPAARS